MADEISTTQAPAAPVPSAAPAAPVTAAVPTTPAPQATTVAVTEPVAPAATTSPAPAAPEIKAASTLLGAEPTTDAKIDAKDGAPEAEKAKDGAAPDAPKTDAKSAAEGADPKKEEGQSVEPAKPLTTELFKLPDGIKADDAGLGEFTKVLSELELAKGDRVKTQEFGQKLLDQHYTEVKNVITTVVDGLKSQFEAKKTEWKNAFENDPEIGGNRRDTTLSSANEFIRTHGGDAKQQSEFRALLEESGLGNHPAMIRVLAKAMSNMAEGRPLPATRPASQPVSKVEKRYGKLS